jgi:hypothetical protein
MVEGNCSRRRERYVGSNPDFWPRIRSKQDSPTILVRRPRQNGQYLTKWQTTRPEWPGYIAQTGQFMAVELTIRTPAVTMGAYSSRIVRS